VILLATEPPRIAAEVLPVFLSGSALFLLWAAMKLRGRELLPEGPPPKVPFRIVDVLAIFVAYVFIQTMLSGVAGGLGIRSAAQVYLFTFLGTGGITLAVYVLALGRRREHGPRAMGILAGTGAWLGTFPLVALALVGWTALLSRCGHHWTEQRVLTDLRGEPVVFFLCAVVLAPLCEEVLFRGLLYPAFRNRIGRGLAMTVTALLLMLVHTPETYPAIFILGLALAYAYERTGTLATPITFHAMFTGWTFLGATSWS
jgi:membrane protease YdiL (CAAX protease family)